MSDESRALDAITAHTEVLRKILTDSIGQTRQYLFLTNSGAAIALMAYLGSKHGAPDLYLAWVSLGFFMAGVGVVGVFNLRDYYARNSDFRTWLNDTERFARDEITVKELFDNLNNNIESSRSGLERLAWIAFGFFMLGTVVSLLHFLA